MSKVWIGVSGWDYDEWQGHFFPDDLPKSHRLVFAARAFNSIEHNGTFYSLAQPHTYRKWYEQAHDDFCYSIKAPRFITHVKRLKDAKAPTANFFASGVLSLKDRLGPILWQLPGNFHFDRDKVEAFFKLLPRDFNEAAALGRQHHDEKLKHEPDVTVEQNHHIRHALEVRHESFLSDEAIGLLKRYGIALVMSDGAGKWPYVEQVTAGFVYIRLHGATQLYESNYSDAQLDEWAKRIETWRQGGQPEDEKRVSDLTAPKRKTRDVYVYFDNTAHGHAPANAKALAERLG